MSDLETYIDAVWILNHAGILLFEENYADLNQEGVATDLITAFLSAILTFSDEAFSDAIEHIKFSNRKIIFRSDEHVLYVVATSKESTSDTQIKKMINQIAEKFEERFGEFFANMEFFDGRVSRFDDFSEDLKQIVKEEPVSVKFLKSLGFKENLKRVEELYELRREKLQKRMKKVENFFLGLSDKIDVKRFPKKIITEKEKIHKWYLD